MKKLDGRCGLFCNFPKSVLHEHSQCPECGHDWSKQGHSYMCSHRDTGGLFMISLRVLMNVHIDEVPEASFNHFFFRCDSCGETFYDSTGDKARVEEYGLGKFRLVFDSDWTPCEEFICRRCDRVARSERLFSQIKG